MYKVLGVEQKGSRILVFLDNDISFLLYKKDIRVFNITEDAVIEKRVYQDIIETLYKRARERALYILDDGYKTEKQIRDKLISGYYPETVINRVIKYLKEYALIDDFKYCKLYIDYKASSRSKKQIIQELYIKGVSRDIIDNAFLDSEYNEEDSLMKVLEKKVTGYDLNSQKDVQRLYRYLIGKGYDYSEVKKALAEYVHNIY